MNAESNDQQFTDLLAYNKVDMGKSHSAQNVIKSSHVVKNGDSAGLTPVREC